MAEPHRRAETAHVLRTATGWGVPTLGTITEGAIEGGDIVTVRPGTIAIGWSGARSTLAGATALARFYEGHGWTALLVPIEPRYLHLDTLFTMLDSRRAVGCIEALDPAFIQRIEQLGIELVPVTISEVEGLGANLVSLGAGRILSPAGNDRVNALLRRRGYEVTEVAIDQFVRCGGGLHCLTMPLARRPA